VTALGGDTKGDDVLISFEGVVKSFGPNHVLRGIDLEIRQGEIFTLLGGSGTGKSVMLKHMVGLMRADAGRIRIEGRDVTRLHESDWVEVRKRIAYVFQGAALFDSLTVFENVAYGLREHLSLGEPAIAARVAECLLAVGLEGIEGRMPSELSGGMRKRVGIARGIALEPEAILYDEPTTGLDPANARRIGQLIVKLRERLDVTSVIVTHDLNLCFAVSDRVGLLGAGRLIAVGTADEIRASEMPEVRDFLAGDLDAEKDLWSGMDLGVRAAGRLDEE
jgi:phospholipid/cholesterol/gamma-HCH transport system ATP-binding protein